MGTLSALAWKAGIVAIIAFGLTYVGYQKGRYDGRIEQLKDSVEAYQERGRIDNETRDLGAYDLCIRIGGVQSDCEQLRGVVEAPEAE